MEASVESIASIRSAATDVLDRLVKGGHQHLIELARREYEEWERVSGRAKEHTRRRHFDANAIIYQRGRWHAAVRMLAALAGFQVSSNDEPDLLELANAISAYTPEAT